MNLNELQNKICEIKNKSGVIALPRLEQGFDLHDASSAGSVGSSTY